MERKFFLMWFIYCCCAVSLLSQGRVPLPELVNPRYLVVAGNQFIISDYPYIYIYSSRNFRLQRKIGGVGEGPGEFDIPQENMNLKERGLLISVCADSISDLVILLVVPCAGSAPA